MKRNRYYTGKHLTAESFIAEQTYQDSRLALLTGMVFDKTIITGLETSTVYSDALTIAPGIASDGTGHLVSLELETTISPRVLRGYTFRREFTLYLDCQEKHCCDYIEDHAEFTLVGGGKAIPIADFEMVGDKIFNVRRRPPKLSSALSRLLKSDKGEIELLKRSLESLSRNYHQALKDIQTKPASNSIRYGTIRLHCANEKILISENIPYEITDDPHLVIAEPYMAENGIVYGDLELFMQAPLFKVVRRAVRMNVTEGTFNVAVELDRAIPGEEISVLWIMFCR